ncbi:MAG: hypothetical protein C0412_14285 [Flavobacterium sp.]|nr:hypothetical protein [Flavobacterium sp.]
MIEIISKKGIFNPKVSIVIPVYNGSNYLKEAIDSALAQTYRNIEVIIVNDGSTDDGKTETIAKSYGDKIRYFYKKNGGVSSALNYGIREMKGEYFSWLSHDDLFYPEKTEKQIEFLNNHPGAKVTFCNTELIDASGKTTSLLNYQEGPEKLRGAIHFWDVFIYACTLLIHKSCIETIGMMNENNRTGQDNELIFLLLHHFDIWHIKEILVKRRDHQESGFYKLNELLRKEAEDLMFRLLDNYGISFFYSENSNIKNTRVKDAKTYQALGNIHLNLMNHLDQVFLNNNFEFTIKDSRFSKYCYQKSFELYPSLLLNLSGLKFILSTLNSPTLITAYSYYVNLINKIHSHYVFKNLNNILQRHLAMVQPIKTYLIKILSKNGFKK